MVRNIYIQGLFVLYLAYASVMLFFYPDNWQLIKNVNLIFHEAGHMIMMLFGSFVSLLGGTIFEIGVPAVVLFHFLRQQKYFAAGFGAWWLSTALYSVSVYAADAQTQTLPLLGGNAVVHDWFTILSTIHLLQYDQFIGNLILTFSILTFTYAGYLFYTEFTTYLPIAK